MTSTRCSHRGRRRASSGPARERSAHCCDKVTRDGPRAERLLRAALLAGKVKEASFALGNLYGDPGPSRNLPQAVIACALERFRLTHGHYPETPEQLIPEYLGAIPSDVVRGRPMIYENDGDGKFTLRSVGPNQTNDRNKPGSDDWLWSFPTNAPAAVVR